MLTRLGRYEIGACVGRGAMADVYRAHDPSIGRRLAIKVLKPELRRNRQIAARFLREAKAAGALSHPNIVTIHDVGDEGGFPYIAMEYLEGETLDALLAHGAPLEPARVIGIGAQLADALSYAHGVGVVHRDVKPSNIILCADGRTVKLLDFGIAGLSDAAEGSDTLRTQAGQVLGTPRYMSPEQALGREADGRSDLFSVGVVLYELVSGRRAFDGANAGVVALQIIQAEPAPLAKVAPECPRGLQFIIEKLLAKTPAKRFHDGAQLARALRREQTASQSRRTARSLPLPVRMALAMGAITAMVLGGSIYAVLGGEDAAMQRMAVASGAAIASFVASNAAVTAADNASLPPGQADWLPVQAFVRSAAIDPNVRAISVVDGAGVVRASSAGLAGRPYVRPEGEPLMASEGQLTVTRASVHGAAFRFVRPITYAGRSFGLVDVSLDASALDAAAELSRVLLSVLGVVTLGAVVAISYAAAHAIASPLRRLRAALADAATGDFAFRLSHRRRDELGELFDAFNALAASIEAREAATEPERPVREAWRAPPAAPAPTNDAAEIAAPAPPPADDATRISGPAAAAPTPLDQTVVTEGHAHYLRSPAAPRAFGLRRA